MNFIHKLDVDNQFDRLAFSQSPSLAEFKKGDPSMRNLIAGILGAAIAASAYPVWAGTLDDVKAKGFLTCGTNPATAGFSVPDNDGKWTGFVVDYCRAVAAGVLGDATKVKFIPLNAKDRFTALQSGEIDILAHNATWTSSRDTSLGIIFAGTYFYDGQGFMVRK